MQYRGLAFAGLFKGEDMGNTFSLLRPNDLWWNYNVDKYLKGQKSVSYTHLTLPTICSV